MQKFSYYLNVLLAIGLFLIVFKYGCNPEYRDKPIVINEVADSNAIYDHVESEYSGKMIILYDSIDNLNKRLKSAKSTYKEKIVEVYKDSIVTKEECTDVINQANDIICRQDSVLGVKTRQLDECLFRVDNFASKALYNKSNAEKLLKANILVTNENEGLKKKVKRNRGIAIIVTAILGGLVLIK